MADRSLGKNLTFLGGSKKESEVTEQNNQRYDYLHMLSELIKGLDDSNESKLNNKIHEFLDENGKMQLNTEKLNQILDKVEDGKGKTASKKQEIQQDIQELINLRDSLSSKNPSPKTISSSIHKEFRQSITNIINQIYSDQTISSDIITKCCLQIIAKMEKGDYKADQVENINQLAKYYQELEKNSQLTDHAAVQEIKDMIAGINQAQGQGAEVSVNQQSRRGGEEPQGPGSITTPRAGGFADDVTSRSSHTVRLDQGNSRGGRQ